VPIEAVDLLPAIMLEYCCINRCIGMDFQTDKNPNIRVMVYGYLIAE